MLRITLTVIAVVISISATACVCGMECSVIKQASFDHGCPERRIQVVSRHNEIYAFKLRVCGKVRKYRDLGNRVQWMFVDVTDGIPKSLGTRAR